MKHALFVIATAGVLWLGCQSEVPAPACQITLQLDSASSDQCDQANGTLLVTANLPGIQYRLGSAPWQASGTFTNLTPGDHLITAQDETGCTVTNTFSVASQSSDLSLSIQTTVSSCDQAKGQLSITATGGIAPYTYSLDGANFQSEAVFEQLIPQTYMVTVRDTLGCSAIDTAHVSSGITLAEHIKPIINTNCALRGCHGNSGRDPNFTVEENILDYAQRIQERTTEGSMPPPYSPYSLTPEEIAQIACWVGDL